MIARPRIEWLPLAALALFAAAAGCAAGAPCDGKPRACLDVRIEGHVAPLDSLSIAFTSGTSTNTLHAETGPTMPPIVPPVQVALRLPATTSDGPFELEIVGRAAGAEAAAGSAQGQLSSGRGSIDITLTSETGGDLAIGDLASADLAVADLAAADLATDLAAPDLSAHDLAGSTGCTANSCVNPPSTCFTSPGACQPSGVCSYPFASPATPCNDGNACTVNDQCNGTGVCVGQSLDGC